MREGVTHGAAEDLYDPLERTAKLHDQEDGGRNRQRTDEEDHDDGRVPGREEPEAREDEAYPEDQEHHERGGHGITRAPRTGASGSVAGRPRSGAPGTGAPAGRRSRATVRGSRPRRF